MQNNFWFNNNIGIYYKWRIYIISDISPVDHIGYVIWTKHFLVNIILFCIDHWIKIKAKLIFIFIQVKYNL